jgi:hypothetical protein
VWEQGLSCGVKPLDPDQEDPMGLRQDIARTDAYRRRTEPLWPASAFGTVLDKRSESEREAAALEKAARLARAFSAALG